jgi:sphingosine kinase
MRSKVCAHNYFKQIFTRNIGQPMKVDLFSITQGEKRTVSFMSQAVGLMADLDIGTDNLRWMGDTRFIYGLLRGRK